MKRHVYGENGLGDYYAAHTNYEKALEMKRHVYGENARNIDLARTLHNPGSVYLGLGDYYAARTNYKKALEMKRHMYGEHDKNTKD
jgi:tetratricopeptide (TPR) repeat protein